MEFLYHASIICFTILGAPEPNEVPVSVLRGEIVGETRRAECIREQMALENPVAAMEAAIAPFSTVSEWAAEQHRVKTAEAIRQTLGEN